tara:strand:+ start:457 stop:702 length:246 start_codon:yes stop_codon:yes gene_type:complete
VDHFFYPDPQDIPGLYEFAWAMQSKEPFLVDKKVIFNTEGKAVNYAENYLGFIEGYNLAAIVVQPCSGTNCNVNSFTLPGN